MKADKYYNGACANQVMRKNGKDADVSGLDAAEECNRLDKRIEELEKDLKDSKFWQAHWKNESSTAKAQLAGEKGMRQMAITDLTEQAKQLERVQNEEDGYICSTCGRLDNLCGQAHGLCRSTTGAER